MVSFTRMLVFVQIVWLWVSAVVLFGQVHVSVGADVSVIFQNLQTYHPSQVQVNQWYSLNSYWWRYLHQNRQIVPWTYYGPYGIWVRSMQNNNAHYTEIRAGYAPALAGPAADRRMPVQSGQQIADRRDPAVSELYPLCSRCGWQVPMASWLVTLCLLHVLGGTHGGTLGGLGGLLSGGNVINTARCQGCSLDKMVTNCPLDVMFILDGSDSIPPISFREAQEYVVNQIESVTATFQGVDVGVLLFSDGVNQELPLQQRTPQQLNQLYAEIRQMKQPRERTELTATLRRARRALTDYDGSPLVPGGRRGKVIVLISDGCDDQDGSAIAEGVQATLDGIYIISVHVSGGGYMKLLTDLSVQVLEIRTNIDWNSVAACPASFLQAVPPNSVCSNVVFAMDGSDSVRKWEPIMRDYLAYASMRYANVNNAIGVIVFGTNVATQSTDTMLPPTEDKQWLAYQIETHLRFPHSGGTGTTAAIETAVAMLSALGSAGSATNTIVIVTDGPALNPEAARQALADAVADGYRVIVVGVGDVLSLSELQTLAGPSSTVLQVDSYLDLFGLDLGAQLCQGGSGCNLQCQNGGTLVTSGGQCRCQCPTRFSGLDCSVCNVASLQCSSNQQPNLQTCTCETARCLLNCNSGVPDSSCTICICNAGFTGQFCDSPVCNLQCQRGGTLVNTNNQCYCLCPPGSSGLDCGTCTLQCQNGGTLVSSGGQCQCQCPVNYSGPDCSVCSLQCRNGGTLVTSFGQCSCQCPSGYSGTDCSVCSRQCQNGGTLVTSFGQCSCTCPAGYSGPDCSVCSRQCQNGGTLVTSFGQCLCTCPPGYSGPDCSVCSRQCQNGGTLVTSFGQCSCTCPSGYSGPDCSVCSRQCQNGGTLVTSFGQCSCTCPAGYSGPDCSVCSRQCQNGGTLVTSFGQCSCTCPAGYGGPDCSVCSRQCQNGGTLVTSFGQCSCTCPAGYSGPDCSVCSRQCQNGGTLVTSFGQCSCTCPAGYSGPDCSVCSRQCLNGGTLVTSFGQCSCSCPPNFTGPDCSVPLCNLQCQNGGTLVTSNGQCLCRCPTGFTGTTCGTQVCNLQCRNGGTLITANNQCRCQCPPNYTGDTCTICSLQCTLPKVLDPFTCACSRCDTTYQCPSGQTVDIGTCSCITCNVQCTLPKLRDSACGCTRCDTTYRCPTGQRLDTLSCSCVSCNQPCVNGQLNENCQCVCNDGFTGADCSSPVARCLQQCQNGGTLLTNVSPCRCECVPPYFGANCTECGLNCVLPKVLDSASCSCSRCDFNYRCPTGQRLDTTSCSCVPCNQPCVNGQLDQNCQCQCFTGFTGSDCSICSRTCPVGQRLDTGSCSCVPCGQSCVNGQLNQNCQCVCNPGYTGADCSIPICNLNCLNGGTLVTTSNPCFCQCPPNYTGNNCGQRTCTQTVSCSSGQYFNTTTCACESVCAQTLTCSSGQIFDPNTCSCVCNPSVTCPSGQIKDPLSCACVCNPFTTCPVGQNVDPVTCQCVCNPFTTCPVGQSVDPVTCQCVCNPFTTCPVGQSVDPVTCQCVCNPFTTCPIGQSVDPVTCQCVAACRQLERCSPGTYFNEDQCRCVPFCTITSCPPGQQLNPINCTCETPCNPLSVRCVNGFVDPTNCQCVCSPTYYSGSDCSICNRQCGPGESLNPSTCSCEVRDCTITCQNGGTVDSNCQCVCPQGFVGQFCELEDRLGELCSAAENPCQNGHIAMKDCQGRCTCQCRNGFAGVYCEIEATAELCNNCWNFNGQYLGAVPGRTDMYVVCVPLDEQRTRFLPNLMHCPPGTNFQRRAWGNRTVWLGCDHIGLGPPAVDPCLDQNYAPNGKYASSTQCSQYFQCGSSGTSTTACCPAGQRFDSTLGDCVNDINCPCVQGCSAGCTDTGAECIVGRDQEPYNPVCPFESLSERTFYHRAAPGHLYNCSVDQMFDSTPDVCRCVMNSARGCLPTVEADYIQGNNENPGYFSGSRREVFERFGGSGFYTDYFEIRLRLKLDPNFGASSGEMAVVTNGDCGEPESVAITIDNNNVYFKVDSENGELQQISVPYTRTSDGWLQISLVYERQSGTAGQFLLTGTVNGQSNELAVRGVIEMRMCALQIAQGYNYANLVGYVDDFQVWLCKPSASG